jgi:C4-dicarboxylate-specific signal transduction histidine kinase
VLADELDAALLLTWFAAVRRRVEAELLQARDKLEIEVAERTQQASLLNGSTLRPHYWISSSKAESI